MKHDGKNVDEVITRCGFRTIRFDPNRGFSLNDQPLKLLGTCNHQDHAGVGVAVPDAIWDFRIRRLKEMGSNAYRAAHNPPAAEFLDACDRLGMLVMDENRNFGSTPEHLRQLDWLVRRDRNHPSVILWSVFNEEPIAGHRDGLRDGAADERGRQGPRYHPAGNGGAEQLRAEPDQRYRRLRMWPASTTSMATSTAITRSTLLSRSSVRKIPPP